MCGPHVRLQVMHNLHHFLSAAGVLPWPLISGQAGADLAGVTLDELQPDGRRAELFVEEVQRTPEFIARQVLRRVTDPRQQAEDEKVKTEFMAGLRFFHGGRSGAGAKRTSGDHYKVRTAPRLDPVDQAQVDSLLAEVDSKYHDLCANLDEERVRGVVRDYLLKHLTEAQQKVKAS